MIALLRRVEAADPEDAAEATAIGREVRRLSSEIRALVADSAATGGDPGRVAAVVRAADAQRLAAERSERSDGTGVAGMEWLRATALTEAATRALRGR